MSAAKMAVTVKKSVPKRVDRLGRRRLARECAKLDPKQERQLADLGLSAEITEWPEY